MYYIYILRCKDDTLYTGITTDPRRRYAAHCTGVGAKYTVSHPPISVEALWQIPTRSAAQRIEAAIKALPRSKKLLLLQGVALPCIEGAVRLDGEMLAQLLTFGQPQKADGSS